MQIDALTNLIIAIGALSGLIVAVTAMYQQRQSARREELTLLREEVARLHERLKSTELELEYARDELLLLRSTLNHSGIEVPIPRRRGDTLLQQLLQREYGGQP